jgi:hypothetical protein
MQSTALRIALFNMFLYPQVTFAPSSIITLFNGDVLTRSVPWHRMGFEVAIIYICNNSERGTCKAFQ